jgi:SAM-dependent methyltransferase
MNKHFDIRNTCPGCSSDDHIPLYSCDYLAPPIKHYLLSFYAPQGGIDMECLKGARFILRECPYCGMIFQQEIPNDLLMHILYEDWINPSIALDQIRKTADLNHYLHLIQEIMIVLRFFRKPPGDLDVLDFGMGWGHWSLAARALGCNVYGMELSKAQAAHAQSLGIHILEWEALPGYQFDFINTEQVFEHLSDPLKTLHVLKASLKEGGIMKISVPDGSDIKKRLRKGDWDAPKGSRNSLNAVSPLEHINCFSRDTLITMADLAGLERITIPLHIQYAYSIIRNPLSAMAKNLLLPLYRDVLKKGIYLFFRTKGPR